MKYSAIVNHEMNDERHAVFGAKIRSYASMPRPIYGMHPTLFIKIKYDIVIPKNERRRFPDLHQINANISTTFTQTVDRSWKKAETISEDGFSDLVNQSIKFFYSKLPRGHDYVKYARSNHYLSNDRSIMALFWDKKKRFEYRLHVNHTETYKTFKWRRAKIAMLEGFELISDEIFENGVPTSEKEFLKTLISLYRDNLADIHNEMFPGYVELSK